MALGGLQLCLGRREIGTPPARVLDELIEIPVERRIRRVQRRRKVVQRTVCVHAHGVRECTFGILGVPLCLDAIQFRLRIGRLCLQLVRRCGGARVITRGGGFEALQASSLRFRRSFDRRARAEQLVIGLHRSQEHLLQCGVLGEIRGGERLQRIVQIRVARAEIVQKIPCREAPVFRVVER